MIDVQNCVLLNIILTNEHILIFFVAKYPVARYVACLQRFYSNIGVKILSCLNSYTYVPYPRRMLVLFLQCFKITEDEVTCTVRVVCMDG